MRAMAPLRYLLVATVAAGALTAASTAPATSAEEEIAQLAAKYFSGENALAVDSPADSILKVAREKDRVAAKASPSFAAKKERRAQARRQEAELNALGEVRFSGTITSIQVVSSRNHVDGSKEADVVERTSYQFADGTAPYEYALNHHMTFSHTADGWAIDGIETEDPLHLLDRQPRSSAELAQVKRETVTHVAKAKAARKVRTDANAQKAKHDGSARTSTLAAGQNMALVPNTCYSCAANWAYKYAIAPPAVDYSRDSNDCTTFVSFAMYHGGWPEVTGLWNSSGAWWYNCDWCTPRHSYAWGGANNFKTFVANSGRVNFLSNVWYVGLADIIQYDVKNYGGVGTADHSMIVTGFDSGGNPLLSYHTTDTRNKPLIQILQSSSATGQSFWAERT